MATRPSVFPDWAVNPDGTDHDVADGTTGQNNVVVPPPEKTLIGWQYNEKPPRQYFNWLARLVSQWIRWLDANTALTAQINVSIPSGGGNVYSYNITLPTGFTWDNTVFIGGQFHKFPDAVAYWTAMPYALFVNFGGIIVTQWVKVGTVSTSPTILSIMSEASDANLAHALPLNGCSAHLIIRARA